VLIDQRVDGAAATLQDDSVTESFVDPRVRLDAPLGAFTGAQAIAPIAAGTVVVAFGGRCVTRADVPSAARAVQIEEALFLVADDGVADAVLHSCEPSCELRGAAVLVAGRDLVPGEAITYDYATSQGTDDDEFECQCGSALCRGKITGHDWMLPELQLRYRGAFSPYLGQRIAALHHIGAERRAFAL
jgi:hypothetical protein